MKGRLCSELEEEDKRPKKKTKVSDLPDDVALNCIARVSRFERASLSISSKRYQTLVNSPEVWKLRSHMNCLEPSLYVCLHLLHEPTPISVWFMLNPVNRQLKPFITHPYDHPESSSIVVVNNGIYIIGGVINGYPTSQVTFMDFFNQTLLYLPSMNMPRAEACACVISGKIYVFGGCDEADSSNWVEVYDLNTGIWEFLFVFTPKMPIYIKHSVVINDDKVYVVDEDNQLFSYSPSQGMFLPKGMVDSTHNCCIAIGNTLFICGRGGRIMYCNTEHDQLDSSKRVKGLEKLQHDIIKICRNSQEKKITIFWKVGDPVNCELWCAEISIEERDDEIWGNIEWARNVFSLELLPYVATYDVLYSAYVNC